MSGPYLLKLRVSLHHKGNHGGYVREFLLGRSNKPPIPERLSPEGKAFLSHCLESDPKIQWTASQLLDPDSFLPLHRNGREGADQQLGGWQGLETGSPATMTLGVGTYCCGPRRGQCPRSRPHSQCLRYLHYCLLGMCPERQRACPCLVLRELCCGKIIGM